MCIILGGSSKNRKNYFCWSYTILCEDEGYVFWFLMSPPKHQYSQKAGWGALAQGRTLSHRPVEKSSSGDLKVIPPAGAILPLLAASPCGTIRTDTVTCTTESRTIEPCAPGMSCQSSPLLLLRQDAVIAVLSFFFFLRIGRQVILREGNLVLSGT